MSTVRLRASGAVAEVSFLLWLLIRGADVRPRDSAHATGRVPLAAEVA